MPETEYEFITKEWMQAELRSISSATAAASISICTSSSSSSPSSNTLTSMHANTTTSQSQSSDITISAATATSIATTTKTSTTFCGRDHDNDHNNHVHDDHAKDLIILDCRSSNEFSECHIRSAVNFSIPSIMLRRLAAGKIDLLSTIKSNELKERIQNGYKVSLFVLYNDVGVGNTATKIPTTVSSSSLSSSTTITTAATGTTTGTATATIEMDNKITSFSAENFDENIPMDSSTTNIFMNNPSYLPSTIQKFDGVSTSSNASTDTSTINILYKRLKQDGCRVVALQDGFTSFRQAFPEWCEDDSIQNKEMESSRNIQADQLMGLRSLRISTPHSDSACSSSAESSDCEGTTHPYLNEAPVEIIPGLFLGNVMHSCDARALQKYNIKYILNVTKDLPNVFEASGSIQYLQIPITDHYSQDLAVHFPAAIQFIEEARSNNSAVLVHCLAGVSRSVTVTLAYLMRKLHLSLNDAFTLVRDRKPDVSPNFHFMQQLHSFEKQLGLHGRRRNNTSTNLNRNSCSSSSNECMMDAIMDATISSSSNNELETSMMPLCSTTVTNANTNTDLNLNMNVNVVTSLHCAAAAAAVAAASSAAISACSTKFTCNCLATDCKCLTATDSYLTQLAKAANSGISPDSGIEFDRWTPSASDTSLK